MLLPSHVSLVLSLPLPRTRTVTGSPSPFALCFVASGSSSHGASSRARFSFSRLQRRRVSIFWIRLVAEKRRSEKKGMIPKEEEMVNSLQRTLTVADFRFLFLSLFSHFLPLSCCFFLSHTQELCIFLIIQVASKFELVLQWRHAFGSQVTKKLQVQC